MRIFTSDEEFNTVFDKMIEEYNDDYDVCYCQDEFDNQTSFINADIPFRLPYGILTLNEIIKEKGVRAKLLKLETSDPDYNEVKYVILFFDFFEYLRFV